MKESRGLKAAIGRARDLGAFPRDQGFGNGCCCAVEMRVNARGDRLPYRRHHPRKGKRQGRFAAQYIDGGGDTAHAAITVEPQPAAGIEPAGLNRSRQRRQSCLECNPVS
jgi:hypothetical protein